jgi:hypothetical protein
MAVRSPNASKGETRFGSKAKIQGTLYVQSGAPSKGSVVALDAVAANGARTTVYLWASTDGKIRTGTTYPTNTEAGTVIGSQT